MLKSCHDSPQMQTGSICAGDGFVTGHRSENIKLEAIRAALDANRAVQARLRQVLSSVDKASHRNAVSAARLRSVQDRKRGVSALRGVQPDTKVWERGTVRYRVGMFFVSVRRMVM